MDIAVNYEYYQLLRFTTSVDANRELSDEEIREDIIPFFQTCFLNIRIAYYGYDREVNEVILTCEKENARQMPNEIVINSKYVLNRRKIKYRRSSKHKTDSRNASPDFTRTNDGNSGVHYSASLSVGYKLRPIDAVKEFQQPTEAEVQEDIYLSVQKLLPNCEKSSVKYNASRQVLTIEVGELSDKQKLPDVFTTATYYLDILAPSRPHRYIVHTSETNSNNRFLSNGSVHCSPNNRRTEFTRAGSSVRLLAERIESQNRSNPVSPVLSTRNNRSFFRSRKLDQEILEEEVRLSRLSCLRKDFTDDSCSTLFSGLKIDSNENSRMNLTHTNAITQMVIREGLLNESDCKIIVHATDENLTINKNVGKILTAENGIDILENSLKDLNDVYHEKLEATKVYDVNLFNLTFKKLFHTIVPQLEGEFVVDLFRQTYENIFIKLEESKLDSIALALLGCESQLSYSIRALCLALDKFLRRYIRKGHNYLRFIQIVNAPKENCELLKFFSEKITSQSQSEVLQHSSRNSTEPKSEQTHASDLILKELSASFNEVNQLDRHQEADSPITGEVCDNLETVLFHEATYREDSIYSKQQEALKIQSPVSDTCRYTSLLEKQNKFRTFEPKILRSSSNPSKSLSLISNQETKITVPIGNCHYMLPTIASLAKVKTGRLPIKRKTYVKRKTADILSIVDDDETETVNSNHTDGLFSAIQAEIDNLNFNLTREKLDCSKF